MNKIYRTIWNETLGAWVAASEVDSARGWRGSVLGSVSAVALVTALTVGFTPIAQAAVATSDLGDARSTVFPTANIGGAMGGKGASASSNGIAIVGDGDCWMLNSNSLTTQANNQGIYGQSSLLGGSTVGYAGGLYSLTGVQYQAVGGYDRINGGAIGLGLPGWGVNDGSHWTTPNQTAGATYIDGYFFNYLGGNGSQQTQAFGLESLAMGCGSHANGAGSTAIGWGATANNVGTVALGINPSATGQGAIAIGTMANAPVIDTIAMGTQANAVADGAIAIGAQSSATGKFSTAIGVNAVATADSSFAFGTLASVTNTKQPSVAIGAGSTVNGDVTGTSKVAGITVLAGAKPVGTVSVGRPGAERTLSNVAGGQISATSTDAINGAQLYAALSIYGAVAGDGSGDNATALGANATASGANSTALGTNALASGDNSTATGANSKATGANSTALGANAQATGDNATAVGAHSVASGENSTALGKGASATGADSLVMGSGASDSGVGNSTVVGTNAHIAAGTTDSSVALGTNSQVSGNAVGTPGVTIAGNYYAFAGTQPVGTVSVGSPGAERTITNLAAGRVTASSTDAINGSQLYATNQAVEALNAKVGSGSGGLSTKGTGENSTVVGEGAIASGANSTAVGANAKATADKTTALGANAAASGVNSTAVGEGSSASGQESLAMGHGAGASGAGGTAVGDYSNASGVGSTALGFKANAAGTGSLVAGTGATDSGVDLSTVLGTGAGIVASVTDSSVALGAGSIVGSNAVGTSGMTIAGNKYTFAGTTPVGTVSVGAPGDERTITNVAAGRVAATSTDAINGSQLWATDQALEALSKQVSNLASGNGGGGTGTGDNSTVTGDGAEASGPNSTATGDNSTASGDNSTATGQNSTASGDNSTATGQNSTASGNNSTATGQNSTASGDNSTATGQNSIASGADSTAMGHNANASGDGSTAVGADSSASGTNSTALGMNSNASGNNSVALGANSQAPEDNTVSVGSPDNTRRITNVAPGINGTDAVNVDQMNSAVATGVTVAHQYTDQKVRVLTKDMYGAAASGIATASLPQSTMPGKSLVALGAGNYAGQSGVALGVSSMSDSGRWVLKFSGTTNTSGDVGVGMGAGFYW